LIDWPSQDWPTICPFCGQRHDAATNAQGRDRLPDDGDVSQCFRCGEFSIFDDKAYGGMRKPTKREQRAIARDARMQTMRTAWKIVKRQ
jgi:hypothetical protein